METKTDKPNEPSQTEKKKLKNKPDCWQQPIQSCMCCGRLSPEIMSRLVPYDMKSRPYTPIWTILFGS